MKSKLMCILLNFSFGLFCGCCITGDAWVVDEHHKPLHGVGVRCFSIESNNFGYWLDKVCLTDENGRMKYTTPSFTTFFFATIETNGTCLVSTKLPHKGQEFVSLCEMHDCPTNEVISLGTDFVVMKPIERLSKDEIVELLCPLGTVGSRNDVKLFWDLYKKYKPKDDPAQ